MLNKIVLTGAAGNLGSRLRTPLKAMCKTLISTDISEAPDKLLAGEEWATADISQMQEVAPLLQDADMVVHFGALVDEGPFEELLGPNFIGAYNIWEAAHQHNVKRVIYASSIHAVGMYDKTEFVGTDIPHRPDTFYGLAKCFAEDLGRMYFEKRGIEAVCLRICSCSDVTNPRALGTWLSYDDLIQLVQRSIDTPVTGFTIIYGVSANDRASHDNSAASFLGYRPKDNAEQFAAEILATAPPPDTSDLAQTKHGGPFASTPLGVGIVAAMGLSNSTTRTEGEQ